MSKPIVPGLPICMRCRQAVTLVSWGDQPGEGTITVRVTCAGHAGQLYRRYTYAQVEEACGAPLLKVAFDEQGQAVSAEREPALWERWRQSLGDCAEEDHLPPDCLSDFGKALAAEYRHVLTADLSTLHPATCQRVSTAFPALLLEALTKARDRLGRAAPLLMDKVDLLIATIRLAQIEGGTDRLVSGPELERRLGTLRADEQPVLAEYHQIGKLGQGLLMYRFPPRGDDPVEEFAGAPAYECAGALFVGGNALEQATMRWRLQARQSIHPPQIIRWAKEPRGRLPSRIKFMTMLGGTMRAAGATQSSHPPVPSTPPGAPGKTITPVGPIQSVAARPKSYTDLLQEALDAGADPAGIGEVSRLLTVIWGLDGDGKARWLKDRCGPIGETPLEALRHGRHGKVIAYLTECIP